MTACRANHSVARTNSKSHVGRNMPRCVVHHVVKLTGRRESLPIESPYSAFYHLTAMINCSRVLRGNGIMTAAAHVDDTVRKSS